jgi:5-deoxy-glucuronate isomerase
MAVHLTAHRAGFGPGLTAVTRFDESDATGIAMAALVLRAGERHVEAVPHESAWLLVAGEVEVEAGGATHRLARASLFDDAPSCLQIAAGESVRITAASAAELLVFRVENAARFAPRVYRPSDVRREDRGAGQVGGACHRIVRTIFDRANAPRESCLVLGEVVNFPGRWSSYPPHHHPQPEMYHYRFTAPQGFGHAELGEQVVKVRGYDTVKISDGVDHPQVAAPGYGMWYAWVIRHLPGRPYDVPEFDPEHTWIMQPDAAVWQARRER